MPRRQLLVRHRFAFTQVIPLRHGLQPPAYLNGEGVLLLLAAVAVHLLSLLLRLTSGGRYCRSFGLATGPTRLLFGPPRILPVRVPRRQRLHVRTIPPAHIGRHLLLTLLMPSALKSSVHHAAHFRWTQGLVRWLALVLLS